MKYQKMKMVLLTVLLTMACFTGLYPTSVSAQQPSSVEAAQALIDASGATWTAAKTSMFEVPAEQLCGSELHPDAKSAKPPSDLLSNLATDAPAALDWRNYNGHDWTTPIRDQGGCGSCYIFGTHAAAEAVMKIQSGTYGYLAEPDFSEQHTLVCPGLGNCTGGYSGDALDFLESSGSPDEDCFPYTASDSTPCSNGCSNSADRLHWIDNWDHPGGYPNWYPSVAQIKTAIETYGPVSTYMYVYSDFRDYYTSGVYTHTFGTALGGHTVTIVGWDDSLQCWIVKNSWGTGWGESGYFRIRWGEVQIEQQTEFVQAGLANLTDYTPSGWTHSVVPRTANDTTSGYCPLPSTLPGNSNSIYLNAFGINNGSETAPPFLDRFYRDDGYVWWSTWGTIGAGGGFYAGNQGTITVKGGRHYIGHYYDYNEQVWEEDESVYSGSWDNYEVRPYVFSPRALVTNSPIIRSAPPKKDPYGYGMYTNDGFSFVVEEIHPENWWSAVGVLPANSAADTDIRLWDIGDYTGSEVGFGSGYLEWSSYGGDASDFVIVNDNMAAAGTYYAGAINYNNASGDFLIEEDGSAKIYAGSNGPFSKATTNVLDIYEAYLGYTGIYGFRLEQNSGTCDLGMSLYDDETTHAQKNEYMSGGYANSYGDGADEYMEVTIPDAGYHGLVVWKADSSDYAKACNYSIIMGQCGTPSAPSTPSPADGATNVSVDADLDWADSTYTEYYEVWLKEGSGAWVKLGETESSAWTLPTLNEYTYYEWFIRAQNICGASTYTYFDFTTDDNTPPTGSIIINGGATTTSSTSVTLTLSAYDGQSGVVEMHFGNTGDPWSAWEPYGTSKSWILPTGDGSKSVWVQFKNNAGGISAQYSDSIILDTTAPSPNPMTWATPPYESSTSQISMAATTASDPTSPINYYFDYTSSPTVGGGGTDSSWQAGTSYSDSGLGVNHQYGYRVYARDGMLNVTTPSAVSYDYTDIETPSGITFGSYGSTYIQARSTNTPSGLTRGSSGLYVVNGTTGANSGWKQDNNLWQSNGLTPNTNYAFRAMARNGDANITPYCAYSYRRTLANQPAAAAFSNVTQSSIQANWTANSNPSGTAYYCENTTAGTNSGWTTATNWNSTALNGGTSYSFQVKSRNGSGIETGWTSLGSQMTLPLADLVVSGIVTDPVHPAPGDSVDIEVTIDNQGLGAAESSFSTTFYKHLSTPPVVGQAGDLTWTLGSLSSGASHVFTDTVTYNTEGSFNMYVLVDSLNDNTEDSEGNNVLGPQAIKVGGSVNIVPIYHLLLLSE